MKKLDYGFLNAANKMPPMRHSITGKKFDIMDSEAAAWLMDVPEIRQKVFNMAVNHKVIVYDAEAGMWHGSEWKAE